ncbi:MAG: response regulator [Bacteroidetes bacterium]|nr:response regulator [Bacteroidota bacterium]
MKTEDILESISGGFFALDKNLNFTYWNHSAEVGTGYTREKVIGKNVFDIFPKAEHDELGKKYKLALDDQSFQSIQSYYRDDFMEAWYDVRIYPTENGLSVFFQDITSQKLEEMQRLCLLELSKIVTNNSQVEDICNDVVGLLSTTFKIKKDDILIFKFLKSENKISLVAPSILEAKLTNSEAVIEIDKINESVIADSINSKSIILTENLSRSIRFIFSPTSTVSTIIKSIIALPIIIENELFGIIEFTIDLKKQIAERHTSFLSLFINELAIAIHRRLLLEELTRKNIELEIQRKQIIEANETLKRFLAFFSHELRSPLTSINGFSDLLIEQASSIEPEKIKEYAETINLSGEHLLLLINDILDLSKLEAGKMSLSYENVPIKDFLFSVHKVLKPALQKKNLSLHFSIDNEVELITIDQLRFKQVLLNLIGNAIKFSYNENIIYVSVNRVNNSIEFVIKDSGMGIKNDELAKLFQPFVQTSNSQEGSGLGLAISKKIIGLHGGIISVSSVWQEGTTIQVKLPMLVNAEDGIVNPYESISLALNSLSQGKKVLIVEDKIHARELLTTYIKGAGYTIEVAINGVEALEKAKTWKPDLITLDILIPVKDGWQVLKELKEHPLCKDIPVVVVSMLDEPNLAFSLGAKEYLVKPIQKEKLIFAIRSLLSNYSTSKQINILLIDDDKSITDLLTVILEAEGCSVNVANNGKLGLELAKSSQPNLIILDLTMPEMSGFEVAHELKKQQSTMHIPIIIMTGNEINDDMKEKLEGFVVKLMSKSGFTKKDLLNEISTIEKK